jgi:lysophospholipase L1-like esterase
MIFGSRSSHARTIGCLLALAFALLALSLAPAANAARGHATARWHVTPGPTSYLALGDSLAFGYSQAKFNGLYPNENPAAYDTGYVDDLARVLRLFNPALTVINDGCPGETTESFINGPCKYQLAYPLHHPYAGGPASAQLTDALAYLSAHPGQVSPITLDIGANDALEVIKEKCNLQPACIAAAAPALFAHIAGNLGVILAQLRAEAPRAQIIVLGLYNPFGSTIAGADQLTAALNEAEQQVAAGFGARFADPLPLFNPPEPFEQPTICLLTNMCTPLVDIHPTDLGYAVLAGTILRQYSFLPAVQ